MGDLPVATGKIVWVGRVLSILASLLLLFSAAMKFKGGPDVAEGFAHLGLPERMRIPLGILELTCTVIYLIPRTAVLGAVLLAGYLGGVICTHWRVGDSIIIPVVLGGVIWLGLYLREDRLRQLIPWRS